MRERERVHFRHRALSVIEALLAAKPATRRSVKAFRQEVPLAYFQNISLEMLYPPEDWFAFSPRDATPKVLWPVDMTILKPPYDGDEPEYHIKHIRSVSPKEARGKARLVTRYMAEVTQALLTGRRVGEHGLIDLELAGTSRDYECFMGSSGWVSTYCDDDPIDRAQTSRLSLSTSMAISMALRHRYEWAVSVGYEDSPSVRLAVDPTAIKDLFKFRDVPSGASRREALLRWIDDNWRKLRHDPDMEGYIRRHLRGGTRFDWEGLGVSILLPEFDAEVEEKLIAERQAMHKAGTDRRPVTR